MALVGCIWCAIAKRTDRDDNWNCRFAGSIKSNCCFFSDIWRNCSGFNDCLFTRPVCWQPIVAFLKKRKRFSKVIERSLNVMNKYHSYSLTMSYFIPGLRNFVPFLYGVSKLSFKTFMLFAYSGAFVWLIIMFSLGYWFGDHKERIFQMETELLLIVAVLTTSYFILKLIKRKRKQKIKSMT